MEIVINNRVEEIAKIISNRAKFQKVALIYDECTSALEIAEIYNAIKQICVFNKFSYDEIDYVELNNGSRVVIYLGNVKGYLKLNFPKNDFINIFCPKDKELLPYFLTENNKIDTNENYLILGHQVVDVAILSSVCFNKFVNYLINVLSLEGKNIEACPIEKEITYQNIMELLKLVDDDVEFFDLQIIKKYDLDYKHIVLVDLLLINAFIVFLQAVKCQNGMIVDVYKATKDNDSLIDKYYSILTNDSVFNLITLNYNYLINYCLAVKKKILCSLELFDFADEEVLSVCEKVKEFSKQDEGVFALLYFFNVFGV